MKRTVRAFGGLVACLGAAAVTPRAWAFLGFADTSLVTVVANPAEAANWAAELEKLNAQLTAATGTLQTLGTLRSYAGDPQAAARAVPELAGLTDQVGALALGARTSADLAAAFTSSGSGTVQAGALLDRSGAGSSMSVFGETVARDAALYTGLAEGEGVSAQLHAQIASEQAARSGIASELAAAWVRYRAATTESQKQAVLSEVSQLLAENQVLDARRRALVDDQAIADRENRQMEAVRSRASDEQHLAESALLNASASQRAQAAETGRLATLAKTTPDRSSVDYSGLRLWTTADTGGAPQ